MGRDFRYSINGGSSIDLDWARNMVRHMYDVEFTYSELEDYIKELIEERRYKTVSVLAYVLADMWEEDVVVITSC